MTDEEAKLLDAVDEHFEELICGDKVEPKVVLTLDEAKTLLECVAACAFPSPFEGFVSENILLRDKLKKRIEQAEGK